MDRIKKYAYLSENICLVGGCALNVLLNSAIAESGLFRRIYITPISGDGGQSLGAILFHNPHIRCDYPYLGRGWGEINNNSEMLIRDLLSHKIVAWFQGRSEIGARSLGHRSFLGLPDSISMRKRLSEKVKKREPSLVALKSSFGKMTGFSLLGLWFVAAGLFLSVGLKLAPQMPQPPRTQPPTATPRPPRLR